MSVSNQQIDDFINKIAPIVKKYCSLYGYKFASPIIAQACLESAYGTSKLAKYFNFFGMKTGSSWKGKSVIMNTKEEYVVGQLTTVNNAAWRAYDSIEEGIKGYFDFISKTRYNNLKTATSPLHYLQLIKQDGYATSSTYVDKNYMVIKSRNLERFDDKYEPEKPLKSNQEIAKEVLQGKWGNGQERKIRLALEGYNYDEIQKLVQELKNNYNNADLKEGDKIKLSQDAVYYNGKKIPNWVKNSLYLYYRGDNIHGAKISTGRSGSITGVVDKKYISKI